MLGRDVFYELLLNGQIKLNVSWIILQNTHLGWEVTRTVYNQSDIRNFKCHLLANQCEINLRTLWELENLGIKDDPNSIDNNIQALERFH